MSTSGPSRGRCILLTSPGTAAIAVVRLTGAGVSEFLRDHFDKAVTPGRCVHGTLSDGGAVIDDPVVVLSAHGTVADLSVHGGPWVVHSVATLARRRGFDWVDSAPRPVHEESVDGDDEIAREVAQYLPLATTEQAVRVLLAQPAAWEEPRREGRGPGDAAAVLADRGLHWLLHPPRVAIVGIPNVGKSTLANQLFAQERVITADVPGTTRDWVGEPANVDGLAVVLVDTPGQRDAADPIEREAIHRSREQVSAADLVLVVIDPTQPNEKQAALGRQHPDALRVVNKSDRGEVEDGLAAIRTIATTGAGIDRLRDVIRAHFLGPAPFDLARRRWWTERQKVLLRREMTSP